MPIYEYQCNLCGKVEEYKCSVEERPLEMSCLADPFCEGTMRQIISLPACMAMRKLAGLNKWAYEQEQKGTEVIT